jgi:hypothetical protein
MYYSLLSLSPSFLFAGRLEAKINLEEQASYVLAAEALNEINKDQEISDMFFCVSRIKRIVEKSIHESIDIHYYMLCLNKVLKEEKKRLRKKQINFIVYMVTGNGKTEDFDSNIKKEACWGVALCLCGQLLHHLAYSPAKIDGQKVYNFGLQILLESDLDGY